MKYLLIIPARGGSKGIPKKNITELNGIPLIEYTIKAAHKVISEKECIQAIVSTDNEEIRRVAINAGADVPFLRPAGMSEDSSSSLDYILHAIEFFSNNNVEIQNIIILQPTSPLRNANDIVSAIDLYESEKSNCLISVYEEHTVNSKIIYKQKGKFGYPVDNAHNFGQRRQDEEPILVRNGAIYITNVHFLRTESRIISNKPLVYIMPKYRSINIDTYDDLSLATKMLS